MFAPQVCDYPFERSRVCPVMIVSKRSLGCKMPATVSKTPVPDRRWRGRYGCMGNTDEQGLLPLGDCSGGRSAGLRRDRRDVLAAGIHSAHLTGYRMVHHRHIGRHDLRISRHGIGKHRLGKPVGPLWSAPGRAHRVGCIGRCSGLGEPGIVAHRVSIDIRLGGGRCDRGHFCPDDGLCDRLVRHSSEPRGVPGVGGNGDGADDHGAFGGATHLPTTIGERPSKSLPRSPLPS